MDLADELELHCQAGSTGRVLLEGGGAVYLRDGRIVHAESADGDLEGVRALLSLFDEKRTVATFAPGLTSRTSVADAPGRATLLDALRLIDERRHARRSPATLVERIARIEGVESAGLLAPGLDPVNGTERPGWERPFQVLLRPAVAVARAFDEKLPKILHAESARRHLVAVRMAAGFACFWLTDTRNLDLLLEELAL